MPSDPTSPAIVSGPGSWCRINPVAVPARDTDEVVLTVAPTVKDKLLAGAPSLSDLVHQKAEDIFRGIQNERVAALFGFKAVAVSNAPFRLVKRVSNSSKNKISNSAESFIALSYCWHNNDWEAKEESSTSALKRKIPISPILFEALLEERVSDDEGVWIDQLCINQSDDDEKAMAIGSMDVIYQQARLVAIVLEDIVIDKNDEEALQLLIQALRNGGKYMYRENLEASRQLTKLAWKIFSSRWFTRAWCGHELLVSDNQLFLIQSDRFDGNSCMVVKMTSSFLFDLSILAKSISSYIATNEFLSLETTYGRQLSRFYIYADQKLNRQETSVGEDQLRTTSYMIVFRSVFGFDSSVVADKLSITLNVLRCGLFFKGPLMTPDQCCYVFYHISLAARDPTSLSTFGKRLQQASWMRWPRGTDIMEPYITGSKHLSLEQIPKFNDRGIELDLVPLGLSTNVHRATSHHIAWADCIIQKCIYYADTFPDQGCEFLDDIVRAPIDIASQRRPLYTKLLACVHECGIEWLVRSWQLKDPKLFDEETEVGLRRLMEAEYKDVDELTLLEQEDLIYIVYLVDALLGAWIPEETGASWTPAWVQIGDSVTSRLLFLCNESEEYSVFIPAILLSAEYSFLRRLWFMVPQPLREGGKKFWTVIGKSCSFGEVDLKELQKSDSLMRSQEICG